MFWRLKVLSVEPNNVGLLYKDNKFFKKYEAGRYARVTDIFTKLNLVNVPIIEQTIHVHNQEVLTKDNIALRFSYFMVFKITDPEQLAKEFGLIPPIFSRYVEASLQDYTNRIRLESQVYIREAVTSVDSSDINTQRVDLMQSVAQKFSKQLKAWGIELVSIQVLDVTFPKDIQDLFAKQLEAKLRGQYELENARTQVASARALKNAAELIKGNEDIKYLQLLETLQKIASKGKHTFVLGEMLNQTK
ncbi:MAG: slipin family protein [Candidatus Doudnabacteria bacterium]|nr:slipin family protein [Candidatus Doudnabacteria bacterium]